MDQFLNKIVKGAFFFLLIVTISSTSWGTEFVKVPGTKVFMKVVGKTDNVSATEDKGGGGEAFKLDILKPYFVLSDEGDYYKITDRQADSGRIGYIHKEQVIQWNTREGLYFAPNMLVREDRPIIQVWGEFATIKKYAQTGDKKTNPPAYEEDDLRSRILSSKSLRPYPVLREERVDISGMERKIYNVMVPASIPEATVKIKASAEQVKKAIGSVVFCIAFDATGSMEPYAVDMARTIEDILKTVGTEQENSSAGFIFYRDISDAKPYWIEEPMPLNLAAEVLERVDIGGGGDAPEPVLDAVYLAVNEFEWGSGTAQTGAKKILIVVLNTDAKPRTIGLSPSVAKDLDVGDIANVVLNKDIAVFSLQAGSDEGDLIKGTLGTLANNTGGEFYGVDAADVKGHFVSSVKNLIEGTVEKATKESIEIDRETIEGSDGYSVIPLRVLDEAKLARLKEIASSVDVSRGSLSIEEGWMFESENIYQKQILIDKVTLEGLARFFNLVGNVTADVDTLTKSAKENLEAMLGEKIPDDAEIQELIEKKLGIHFNRNLLAFNFEDFAGLVPVERVSLQKRIQSAGDKLTSFVEASTVEFNKEPLLWMRISYLP